MTDYYSIDDSELHSSARMGIKPTEDGARFDLTNLLQEFTVDEEIYSNYEDWAEANGIEPVIGDERCTSPTFETLATGLDKGAFSDKSELACLASPSPSVFEAEPIRISTPVQINRKGPALQAADSVYNKLFLSSSDDQAVDAPVPEPVKAAEPEPEAEPERMEVEDAPVPEPVKEAEPEPEAEPERMEVEDAPVPEPVKEAEPEPEAEPERMEVEDAPVPEPVKEAEPEPEAEPERMEVEDAPVPEPVKEAEPEPEAEPERMEVVDAPVPEPVKEAMEEPEKLIGDTQQNKTELPASEKYESMADSDQKPRPPSYISAPSTAVLPLPLEEVDQALTRIRKQRQKHMRRYRDIFDASKKKLADDLKESAKACEYVSKAMKKDLKNTLEAREVCLEEIMRRRDGYMIKFMKEKGYEYAKQVTEDLGVTAKASAYITEAMSNQSSRRKRRRIDYATMEKMIGLKSQVCMRQGGVIDGEGDLKKELVMYCCVCEGDDGDFWVCSIRGCDKVHHITCLDAKEKKNNSKEYPDHWVCPVCIHAEFSCVDPEGLEEAEADDEEFTPEGSSDSDSDGDEDEDDGREYEDSSSSSDEDGSGSDDDAADSEGGEDDEVLDFTGPDHHNLDEYVVTLKIPDSDKRAILTVSDWLGRLREGDPGKYAKSTAYAADLLSLMACKEELEDNVREDLENWIAKFARHNKNLAAEVATIRKMLLKCPVYVSDEPGEGSDSDEKPKKRRRAPAPKAPRARANGHANPKQQQQRTRLETPTTTDNSMYLPTFTVKQTNANMEKLRAQVKKGGMVATADTLKDDELALLGKPKHCIYAAPGGQDPITNATGKNIGKIIKAYVQSLCACGHTEGLGYEKAKNACKCEHRLLDVFADKYLGWALFRSKGHSYVVACLKYLDQAGHRSVMVLTTSLLAMIFPRTDTLTARSAPAIERAVELATKSWNPETQHFDWLPTQAAMITAGLVHSDWTDSIWPQRYLVDSRRLMECIRNAVKSMSVYAAPAVKTAPPERDDSSSDDDEGLLKDPMMRYPDAKILGSPTTVVARCAARAKLASLPQGSQSLPEDGWVTASAALKHYQGQTNRGLMTVKSWSEIDGPAPEAEEPAAPAGGAWTKKRKRKAVGGGKSEKGQKLYAQAKKKADRRNRDLAKGLDVARKAKETAEPVVPPEAPLKKQKVAAAPQSNGKRKRAKEAQPEQTKKAKPSAVKDLVAAIRAKAATLKAGDGTILGDGTKAAEGLVPLNGEAPKDPLLTLLWACDKEDVGMLNSSIEVYFEEDPEPLRKFLAFMDKLASGLFASEEEVGKLVNEEFRAIFGANFAKCFSVWLFMALHIYPTAPMKGRAPLAEGPSAGTEEDSGLFDDFMSELCDKEAPEAGEEDRLPIAAQAALICQAIVGKGKQPCTTIYEAIRKRCFTALEEAAGYECNSALGDLSGPAGAFATKCVAQTTGTFAEAGVACSPKNPKEKEMRNIVPAMMVLCWMLMKPKK